MTDHALLVVIPAKGNSRGVPRKNLRLVGDEPLTARAVRHARAVLTEHDYRIVVTTNDPTIAQVASLAGAEVLDRSDESETAEAPVAMIVNEVCARLNWSGPTVIWQPSTVIGDNAGLRTLRKAIAGLGPVDSIVVTRPSTAVTWGQGVQLLPRVNRQGQKRSLDVEVGIFATTSWPAPGAPFDAPHVSLAARCVSIPSAVDIDTHHDLAEARAVSADPPRVVFMPQCGDGVGTGHVHRALVLADRLSDLDVAFIPDALDDWGRQLVADAGYPTTSTPGAAVVCVDGPGQTADLVESLRYLGARAVVSFEDDGPAAYAADLAVNELLAGPGLAGPRYATIRPEFLSARRVREDGWAWRADRALVTFGGSDPADMTANVAEWLSDFADVHTVTPPLAKGGSPWEAAMAEMMADAAIVVCSGGRTMYEAMCVGVPVVCVPVNEREARRPVPPSVVRLPESLLLDPAMLQRAVSGLLADDDRRQLMSDAGRAAVDGRGADRVAQAIRSLADDLL